MRGRIHSPQRQRGATLVEFAIVGTLALVLLFGVLEIARAVFVANALAEATRRGARVAAVCPVNDPAVAQIATFNVSGGGDTSPIVKNLDVSDFELEYLDRDGTVLGDPDGSFLLIRYVQVRVVNFEHSLLIPFVSYTATMPEFETTLPRESLGIPRSGVVTPC